MIPRKKFYKLYESLTNLTEIYGELVEIAKTFEEELGAEDIATTGLLEAVAKVNELILRYNPSAGELDKAQGGDAQPLQDLQNFDDEPLQAQELGQAQEFGQGQAQGQGQVQGQPLQAQAQEFGQETQLQDEIQEQL